MDSVFLDLRSKLLPEPFYPLRRSHPTRVDPCYIRERALHLRLLAGPLVGKRLA
jgi:hypothetical protein